MHYGKSKHALFPIRSRFVRWKLEATPPRGLGPPPPAAYAPPSPATTQKSHETR